MKVKIANRTIGEGEPCFVIAEAGVNHNGDVSLAKRLIDVARGAGADAVKFQTFKTEQLVSKSAEKAAYQKETTDARESQFEMIKKLELSKRQHWELGRYADRRDIMFLSTPYDKGSVDLLVEMGVPALKISSADITNHPLLSYAAAKGLPIILSTGMSTLGEVEEAVGVITNTGNEKLVLLHCAFNYPAKLQDLNLRAMITLRQSFGFPVGYSDHTMGIEVSLAAVALGATVIEKHFTLDRNLPGPDHRASLEPAELNEMVTRIRNIERALGSPLKRPCGAEVPNRAICRRSVIAAVDIPRGVTIGGDMLAVKRPGTGISPKHLEALVGRKVVAAIKKDEFITWDKVR
jgi:N,N'-diacetyllegionaminate synthase